MNICLFCGTFNPIHNAHLRAAEYVSDTFGYGKIIFIPTNNAPHKEVLGCQPENRLEMVKLAIAGNKKFEVSDIEFQRNERSYTYDTIVRLNKIYGNQEKWPFIIGTDAFCQVKSWYRSSDLKNLLKFIVLTRDNKPSRRLIEYIAADGYDVEFTNLSFCDISSTGIRKKVECGEDISEFVPPEVENYIYEHGLYKN